MSVYTHIELSLPRSTVLVNIVTRGMVDSVALHLLNLIGTGGSSADAAWCKSLGRPATHPHTQLSLDSADANTLVLS